jgi:hypothetical protein
MKLLWLFIFALSSVAYSFNTVSHGKNLSKFRFSQNYNLKSVTIKKPLINQSKIFSSKNGAPTNSDANKIEPKYLAAIG